MKNGNTLNLLFKLLNAWFAFVAMLILASAFPHWKNTDQLFWINEALYFLVFLFSIFISLKDRHNRDIYINLSIYLAIVVASFLQVFMGKEYMIGNNYTLFYYLQYSIVARSLFLNVFVVYTVVKQVFYKWQMGKRYALTAVIVLPVVVYCFYPYLSDPQHIFAMELAYRKDLYSRLFTSNHLSLVFLLLYGYLVYKKDHPLGEYINSLMAFFFFFSIFNAVDNLALILQFKIPQISQYFLMACLVILTAVLFQKLCFLASDYGQFYEALLNRKVDMERFKIQRRRSRVNTLTMKILNIYFHQRRFYLISLCWVSGVVFLHLHASRFITVNIAAFLLCFLVVFAFVNSLYRKRERQKHLLSHLTETNYP